MNHTGSTFKLTDEKKSIPTYCFVESDWLHGDCLMVFMDSKAIFLVIFLGEEMRFVSSRQLMAGLNSSYFAQPCSTLHVPQTKFIS